ncbi:NAD(P)H-hydrate dehydratase [Flavobacterium sp. RHBU_24]|uniref:NAD(P)H-hydrate dehydratase n=1 Tax=Flavobacterium sp. RHBU_24 TaxID=3391185 RepID=UPI003984FDAA
MKIFETINIREADKITIENQQISYYQLMERAATEAFLWIKKHYADKETTFHVFCGRGNNGGDGLVIARLLHQDNYPVKINIIEEAGNPTPEYETALQLLKESGLENNKDADYTYEKRKLIYIDALFGVGLNRDLPQSVADTINKINRCEGSVISIDVPSGLFLDRPTDFAVESDIVLTFQFPKLAFYLPGNCKFVNRIVILDIGLDKGFIKNTPSDYSLTDLKDACARYRPVKPHAHKGTQGHALIIGGSYGKIGAVCLSAKAALKSGCGLVTAYIPKCGYEIMQSYFPEAMALTNGQEHLTNINFDVQPKAIGIGPGIGQEPETQQAIHDFLQRQNTPLVIDADALNILSQNKEWLTLLPENTILTPHPKELERLMGSWDNDFDKLDKIKAFSAKYKVVLVAKDAHTMVVYGNDVHINSTGNAALATGGSGDCLTGIITGLLAQGYNAVDAALFGVYLHGLTADIALPETGMQAFTASDIIKYIGRAYLKIEADCNQK